MHNTSAAVAFLKALRPEGPWVLTSIVPDGRTTTQTFTTAQEKGLVEWIEARQGKENVYYTLNATLRTLASKAKKADIAAAEYLHVDIDPRAGEPLQAERERALRLLTEANPPPTAIIDSGGGYQALWRLKEPFEVNGDERKAEELEAYNIQLEVVFGADACHNVDRILRLPGTVNVPNKKKIAKGRTPSPTSLVRSDWSVCYPLGQFKPAQKVQLSGSAPGGFKDAAPERVSLKGGNVERLPDVHALPEKVGPYTKMLIVQGDDPDDPTKYPSRSEVVMRVCCDLIRAEVPDEIIFSVLTDPSFAISQSILEKPRPEKYALRQIERAREETIHPMLRELNEKHAVIADIGGRCRIISEVMDYALGRTRISRQSFDDFRNRYRHIKVQVGSGADGKAIEKSSGSWWIDNPMRRQYETIIFAPGKDVPNSYNLWRGFGCDALPGDCSLYLEHTKNVVCGGNEQHFQYLIRWLARAVQHPDRPGETAIVLRGKMGTGKGFFVREFGKLWGRHYMQVSDPKHLVGSFNAHLRDTVVLFADEAFYAGDKKHESVLKQLVTEELITIEAKGVDAEAAPNYTHILMAANQQWVVPAGPEERRYFVLDVGEDKMQDTGYFARLKKQMDTGGRQALLHHLMHLDLSDFDVRKVPQTKALREQKLLSLSPEESWWYDKLWYGRTLERGRGGWERDLPTKQLQADYIDTLHKQGIMRRMSQTALGRFLVRACGDGWPRLTQRVAEVEDVGPGGMVQRRRERAYFYTLPTLEDCRARWAKLYGGDFEWPEALKTEEAEPQDVV